MGMLTHTFGPTSHLQDPPCNVKIMTSLTSSDLIKTRFSESEVGAEGQAHNILVLRFMNGVCYHC